MIPVHIPKPPPHCRRVSARPVIEKPVSPWMTGKEVAALLNVSEATVSRLARAGQIRGAVPRDSGIGFYFVRAEVERFVKGQSSEDELEERVKKLEEKLKRIERAFGE